MKEHETNVRIYTEIVFIPCKSHMSNIEWILKNSHVKAFFGIVDKVIFLVPCSEKAGNVCPIKDKRQIRLGWLGKGESTFSTFLCWLDLIIPSHASLTRELLFLIESSFSFSSFFRFFLLARLLL